MLPRTYRRSRARTRARTRVNRDDPVLRNYASVFRALRQSARNERETRAFIGCCLFRLALPPRAAARFLATLMRT